MISYIYISSCLQPVCVSWLVAITAAIDLIMYRLAAV
jgi:hypothetical protein